MPNHERPMLAYVLLADLSQQKRQLPGRDRFLILTGAAACRTGWLDVAERCRELVLANNSKHLIGHFESFADALRSPEFEPFLKRLERFCGYERAEHLLAELHIVPEVPQGESEKSSGQFALAVLSRDHWNEPNSHSQ